MPNCDRPFAPAVADVVACIRDAHEVGHIVCLYSARPWTDYRLTERWLKEREIPYDLLLLGKWNYDLLLDDRATSDLGEFIRRLNAD